MAKHRPKAFPQALKRPVDSGRFDAPEQAAEKRPDVVILSGAKNLLFTRVIENNSRFFSPAKNAGLQNDILPSFSAACEGAPLRDTPTGEML